jgi:hypothetical protein
VCVAKYCITTYWSPAASVPEPIWKPVVSGFWVPSPNTKVELPMNVERHAIVTSKRTVVGALIGSTIEYVMLP